MAISLGLRWQILERDGFVCWVCGSNDAPRRICYIEPIWMGGTEHPSNLAAICVTCGGTEVDIIPAGRKAVSQ